MAVDPEELTDAQLASMAAAALHDVHAERNRAHDTAAAQLGAAVLTPLAAGLNVPSLLAVIDPTAARRVRRAAVSAELERQTRLLGLDTAWHDTARDAHTAAALAGAAAAAHVLSAGKVPAAPAPSPFPNPFDATAWVTEQRGGMAGDLVDAVAAAMKPPTDDDQAALLSPPVPGAGLTLADITMAEAAPRALTHPTTRKIARKGVRSLMAAGIGALYYLDLQVGNRYLNTLTEMYLEVGYPDQWWCAIHDERLCGTCLGYEARSPYTRSKLPAVPHALCRCFVMPGHKPPGGAS